LATVSGTEAVRQSLLMLISTRPGERVMRPDYGCPLHRLMFQPVDATAAGLAIHYVEQAVRRWEPRVEIIDVDAGPGPDEPTELVVRLSYRVRATRVPDTFEFAIDLAGATR
jgi:phage baseplate assembly protein W